MTTVAIHQPNYLPWLGYFAKMAQADVFVLLDDVQFSKGSYTNRVQIARDGAPVWLTLPVRHEFGAAIDKVAIARPDWARSHLDTLRQAYRKADHFKAVWPDVQTALAGAEGGLSATNAYLIRWAAARLGLTSRLVGSASLGISGAQADERLARIVDGLAPGGTYLSGAGGAKYQSEETFAAHGLSLAYSAYKPPQYARSGEPFLAGLSVLDAVFHLGWDGTARILRPAQ